MHNVIRVFISLFVHPFFGIYKEKRSRLKAQVVLQSATQIPPQPSRTKTPTHSKQEHMTDMVIR